MSDDHKIRIAGLILLAAGFLLIKISILDTFAAVAHGAPRITFSKAIILAPAFLALGVFMLVGGKRVEALGKRAGLERTPDGRISQRMWVIVILFFGLGLGLYLWIEHLLASRGYQ